MPPPRFFPLAAEEPYRFFFPLGVLAGVVGVALWPLWLGGVLQTYPGLAHARIMTEGFFTAFILGFLGTAGPRMLGVRHFSAFFWIVVVALWLIAQGASIAGAHNLAEAAFAVCLATVLVGILRRFPQRNGLPPAGFIAVVLSLALAIPAAATQMPSIQHAASSAPVALWLAGRAFLVEGFVLLPILGAAPFFFGRFGGLPPKHFPAGNSPDTRWKKQAIAVVLTCLLVVAALSLKATGSLRSGAALQALVTAGYVFTQVPFRYPQAGSLGRLAQFTLFALVAGPLLEVFLPGERLAWRHLLLIGGFQGAVISVGTWVIFAHAGKRARLTEKWIVLRVIVLGLIIAMISRIAAEFLSGIYHSHLLYASLFWLAATLAWLWILLPRLREDG